MFGFAEKHCNPVTSDRAQHVGRGGQEGGEGEEHPEGRPGHDLHPQGHGHQRV